MSFHVSFKYEKVQECHSREHCTSWGKQSLEEDAVPGHGIDYSLGTIIQVQGILYARTIASPSWQVAN